LLDWATAYLEFAKSKFVQKTWDEKRSMFKRFFLNIEPGTPVEDLQPGQVLLFLQNENNTRSGYAANKDRKNLVAAWN
jgi:hypothetical protein